MKLALTLILILLISVWFYAQTDPLLPKKNPHYERIVAMAPSYCETVAALGQAHRLVGVTSHCELDLVKDVPRVGSFSDANFEVILSLKPDLVLAVPHVFATENLRRLKENGIEIFAHQPDSLSDIRFINQELGEKLGISEQGLLLNQRLDEALAQAKAQNWSGKQNRPTILLAIADAPFVVAGANTFIAEIMEAMGFSNLASNPRTAWPIWPLEKLISAPPDVFVMLEGVEKMNAYQRLFRSLNLDLHNFGPTLIVPERPLFFSPSPAIIEDIKYFSHLLSTSV